MNRANVAVNAGLAMLFTAVLAAEAASLADEHRNVAFDLGIGLALCTAAMVRERSRFWAAVAGLAMAAAAEVTASWWHWPGEPGLAATLALFVLAGSALRTLPARQAAVIAVLAGAVGVAETHTHPAAGQAIVLGWAVTVTAVLGLRFWLPFRAARRETAIETVKRSERLELARELHDAAAHHLTGIVIQAQAARIAARANAEALDRALAGIESGGADALASMRQVIGLLRREAADTDGLTAGPPRLADLVASFTSSDGRPVRLEGAALDESLPPELTSTIYRVVQEALTNITRHAPVASDLAVTVTTGPHDVTVEIIDDAPVQTSRFPHASGYGLIGLRERVETLGGTFTAGRRSAGGWSVQATLPTP
jgi:signal transduction histidine kinase